MATLVVYADDPGGYVEASNAAYATALAGTGSLGVDATDFRSTIGQAKLGTTYYVDETFLAFSGTVNLAGGTVTAAVLDLAGYQDDSATDFDIRIAAYAWADPLASAAFRTGTQLAALTPVALFATAGWTLEAYNTFSDTGPGLASVIDNAGTTRLIAYSSRSAAGTTPTAAEYVNAYASEQGDPFRPRLTITYTPAAATAKGAPFIGGGFFP
jgi:hypothetical protein